MSMFNAVASLFFAYAVAAPEDVGPDALPVTDETTPVAAPECAYGNDREDYMLCLAKCVGVARLYDAVGMEVHDTANNRRMCRDAAKDFCEKNGVEYDSWCFGREVWDP